MSLLGRGHLISKSTVLRCCELFCAKNRGTSSASKRHQFAPRARAMLEIVGIAHAMQNAPTILDWGHPRFVVGPGTILLDRRRDGDYPRPRHFPYFAIPTNGRLLSAEPKKYEKRQGITTCRLETQFTTEICERYHLRHARAPPHRVSQIADCSVVLGSMDRVWGWDRQIRPHVGNR